MHTKTGVFSSVVANVTSVSGVSKIVTQMPGGIVEFSTHLGKLSVRRNMKCMRSLTVGNYLAPPTLSPVSGAVLFCYLLVLPHAHSTEWSNSQGKGPRDEP